VLVGEPRTTLAGSAYARVCAADEQAFGAGPPPLELEREAALQRLAVESARGAWALAAHGVSRGGMGVAIVEMLLAGPPESGLGAALRLDPLGASAHVALFSESPAIVFAAAPAGALRLLSAATEAGLGGWTIGQVTADGRLAIDAGGERWAWEVAALRSTASTPLERLWNEELDE